MGIVKTGHLVLSFFENLETDKNKIRISQWSETIVEQIVASGEINPKKQDCEIDSQRSE